MPRTPETERCERQRYLIDNRHATDARHIACKCPWCVAIDNPPKQDVGYFDWWSYCYATAGHV